MKEGNKLEFIYWFAFYNLNSASVRYRAKYPLDFLKKNQNINSYLVIPSYTTKGIYTFLKAFKFTIKTEFTMNNKLTICGFLNKMRENLPYNKFIF